jgi:hypothetical protein
MISNSCGSGSLEDLDHADAKVRLRVLRDLCPCHVRRNVPDIWNRVLHLVHDDDVRVRSAVLHLIADGSPTDRAEEMAWAVGTMVNDADLKLRRRARRVLAAFRRDGSVNVL